MTKRPDAINAAISDLERDAQHADEQALCGPFYPAEKLWHSASGSYRETRDAITPESLRAYAAECRRQAKALADGASLAAYIAGRRI